MHRSGTSALTGLLVHLGVQGPRTLMPATEFNERGYWESTPFHQFHERLLMHAGTEWDLWTSAPAERLTPMWAEALNLEFKTLLDQEFGDAPLFVVKDPRVCRLMPFWRAGLQTAGVDPLAVIVVRSPLEVAASLAARDRLPLDHALLSWLRHVLDAEAATRGLRRSIVRYQDLLGDWKSIAERLARDLGLQWQAQSPEAEVRISEFLGSDLRHHIDRGEAPDVPPMLADWVSRTTNALDGLLGDDPAQNAEALAALDQVRSEFDRGAAVFGPSIESERRTQRREASSAEERARTLAVVEGQLEQARQYQKALLTDVDDLRRHRDALMGELATTRHELATARHELAAMQPKVADLTVRLDTVSARLDASDRRRREIEQSRTWRWSRPIRVMVQHVLKLTSRSND